ncbi:MAG: hypothetical protein ACLQDQ_15465 [Myxococcaceae bacterium]
MHLPRLFRALASPELLFGLFHTLVWLLLALEISAGVVAPLAAGFAGARPL